MTFDEFKIIHKSDSKIRIFPSFIRKYVDADSHLNNESRFCVADGVTRDLTNGEEFRFTKNPKELLKTIKNYPKVFELKEVADICTRIFTSSNLTELEQLLIQINSKINEFNVTHIGEKVDYLGNNLFGVTAAGGIIHQDHMNCFNVADSNIMVLDKFYRIISRTTDDFTSNTAKRDQIMRKKFPGLSWSDNNLRETFRRTFRNTDEQYSFGTLTGEPKALEHVHYYDFDLSDATYIFAYTDGFIDVMETLNGREDVVIGRKLALKKEATAIGYKKR